MGEEIRGHIRSNVIGYVALFVALSGTAYAVDGPLPGTNQVGSEDIIDGEVRNPDIAADAIGHEKIADGGVRPADIRDDSLTAADLANGAVQTQEIATGAVQSEDVLDASLTGTDVANSSLTGTDIAPASLTGVDVEDSSLTGVDVKDGSLIGADVADSSLTGADVQNSSLTGSDIAPGSLTGSDIADTSSIGGAEIDESDLSIPFVAVDDTPDTGECDGLLSSSPEVCADVSITLQPPFSRVFIVASGGWSKELGDPADSVCRLFAGGQLQAQLLMGDNTGFGGGHSSTSAAMPFTLNATTDRLDPGIYEVELECDDNSSGDQDTLIRSARISALAAG